MRSIIKKILFLTAVVIVVGFVAIQLVPYGRYHDNPSISVEPPWDSQATRELAVRACFDCHSNEVVWPWYSNIAPISWWVQDHVDEGRSELNFSEWGQSHDEADESAESILEGEMPPSYYKPWARLSQSEMNKLVAGLRATFGNGAKRENDGEDHDDDDDD